MSVPHRPISTQVQKEFRRRSSDFGGLHPIGGDAGSAWTGKGGRVPWFRVASGVEITRPPVGSEPTWEEVPGPNGRPTIKNDIVGGVEFKGFIFDPSTEVDNQYGISGPTGQRIGQSILESTSATVQNDRRVPTPTISDISVNSVGDMGMLKTATVTWTAFSPEQMEMITDFFCIAGKPVVLEWGWSSFKGDMIPLTDASFIQELASGGTYSALIKRKYIVEEIENTVQADAHGEERGVQRTAATKAGTAKYEEATKNKSIQDFINNGDTKLSSTAIEAFNFFVQNPTRDVNLVDLRIDEAWQASRGVDYDFFIGIIKGYDVSISDGTFTITTELLAPGQTLLSIQIDQGGIGDFFSSEEFDTILKNYEKTGDPRIWADHTQDKPISPSLPLPDEPTNEPAFYEIEDTQLKIRKELELLRSGLHFWDYTTKENSVGRSGPLGLLFVDFRLEAIKEDDYGILFPANDVDARNRNKQLFDYLYVTNDELKDSLIRLGALLTAGESRLASVRRSSRRAQAHDVRKFLSAVLVRGPMNAGATDFGLPPGGATTNWQYNETTRGKFVDPSTSFDDEFSDRSIGVGIDDVLTDDTIRTVRVLFERLELKKSLPTAEDIPPWGMPEFIPDIERVGGDLGEIIERVFGYVKRDLSNQGLRKQLFVKLASTAKLVEVLGVGPTIVKFINKNVNNLGLIEEKWDPLDVINKLGPDASATARVYKQAQTFIGWHFRDIIQETTIQTIDDTGKPTGVELVPSPPDYKPESNFAYITYGLLEEILNKHVIGTRSFVTELDSSETKLKFHKNLISTDKRVCILPNASAPHYSLVAPLGELSEDVRVNLTVNFVSEKGGINHFTRYVGDTGKIDKDKEMWLYSIFLNLGMVRDAFRSTKDVYDALERVMDQVNAALLEAYYFKLERRYGSPRIIEVSNPHNISTRPAFVFEYNDARSFIEGIDFSVDLPEQIGLQALSPNKKDSDPYFSLSSYTGDLFKLMGESNEEPLTPLPPSQESINDKIQKLKMGSFFWVSSEMPFPVELGGYVNYVYPDPEVVMKNTFNLVSMRGTVFPGANVSLTFDGISGIRFFDAFNVRFVPKVYQAMGMFIVKGISHTISTSGWSTKIDSYFMINPDRKFNVDQ